MNSNIQGQATALTRTNANSGEKAKKRKLSAYEVVSRLIGVLPSRAIPFFKIAPFGLAFLSMERRFTRGAVLTMLITSIGYMSLLDIPIAIRYITAMAMYLAFLFFLGNESADITLSTAVGVAMVAVAVSGVAEMIWSGFSLGSVIALICDVLLTATGVIVFDRNRRVLLGKKTALYTMNPDEKLCMTILVGIVLLGLKSLEIDGYVSVANIAGLWLITMVISSCGLSYGVVCGVLVGAIIGLNDDVLEQMAIFTICSLGGGIVAKLGRTVTVAAVAFCAIGAVIAGLEGTAVIFGYADIPLFVIAVMLTPDYIVRNIGRIIGIRKSRAGEERCREYVKTRLEAAACSFRTLAQTFCDLSDRDKISNVEDTAVLFDGVADRVCRECSRLSDCWVTGFNYTYRSMLHMLEAAERKGSITENDAGEYFGKKCLRLRSVVREMNRLFEIYKINCVWKSKLCENRVLAGEQLASVAQILEDVSCDMYEEKPDFTAEEEIRSHLFERGVEVGSVDVTLNPKGRYTVHIEILTDGEIGESRRIAESVIHTVLGVKMSVLGAVKTRSGMMLKFALAEGFTIESGKAMVGYCEECGDSNIMRYLSGGKYAAALSDGMGTGHQASRDSSATVKLLGEFLEAGFDKSVAVRLVNSIMVMKSADEAFATVDMCVIDLFSGDAEFVKNGAEPSYIKRADCVETVRAASLPVGIMQEMEIESFAHRLDDGDIIVMTSDGLQMKRGYEDWIKTMVEEADGNMPAQELADRIIEMAETLHGNDASDDMTVMVMKVIERV